MSLMKRISLIFRSKANTALDRAEDPRQTLDYSYQRQLDLSLEQRNAWLRSGCDVERGAKMPNCFTLSILTLSHQLSCTTNLWTHFPCRNPP